MEKVKQPGLPPCARFVRINGSIVDLDDEHPPFVEQHAEDDNDNKCTPKAIVREHGHCWSQTVFDKTTPKAKG